MKIRGTSRGTKVLDTLRSPPSPPRKGEKRAKLKRKKERSVSFFASDFCVSVGGERRMMKVAQGRIELQFQYCVGVQKSLFVSVSVLCVSVRGPFWTRF